ncbi:hypothetical protein BFG60_0442 [Microcystis aeruginosa NIES-98]|nr:hypothetical protein BFG60_0442 [Microcystis aeruginosa NIES-98]
MQFLHGNGDKLTNLGFRRLVRHSFYQLLKAIGEAGKWGISTKTLTP